MKEREGLERGDEQPTFFQRLRRNWLFILLIVVLVGFSVFQHFSNAAVVEKLNATIEEKIGDIEELQTEIDTLEEDISKLNEELIETQKKMEEQSALFWSNFDKIKKESVNKSDIQLKQEFMESWPGR